MMLILLLCLTGTAALENQTFSARAGTIDAVSLPESELGGETAEGDWRYALRADDGWAEIIRYEGSEQDVRVPVLVGDGISVAGLAAGSLAGVKGKVRLNGNILHIAPGAFGDDKPVIVALNGTYAQAWAAENGFPTEVPADYELMPGVIDFSDAPKGHIRRAGEDYIRFARLEGCRLSVGSVFWYRDERGITGIYKVTTLAEEDGWTVAGVTAADVKTTVKNAHISGEYTFTDADFTPAAGVRDAAKPADSKSPASVEGEDKTIAKVIPISRDTGIKSDNDSLYNSSLYNSNDITVTFKVKTDYDLEIIDGEIVEFTEKETKSAVIDINFPFINYKYEGDLLKKLKEKKDDGEYLFFTEVDVGSLTLKGTGLFTIGIDLKAGLKADVTGTFSATYATTTERRYADGEWTVLEDNGNVSQKDWKTEISFAFNGKFYIKVTGTIALARIVKVFEASAELALKAKVEKEFTDDPNDAPCITLEIGPEITLEAYAGLFVESTYKDDEGGYNKLTLGAKAKVFGKTIPTEVLIHNTCKIHYWPGDVPGVGDVRVHLEDMCPFSDRVTVVFETRTSQLVEERKVFRGKPIPWDEDEYRLEDDETAGHFLGWATSEDATAPDWIFEQGTENYLPLGPEGDPMTVEGPLTLYAVWENNVEVRFDSQGGSEIPSQIVPVGGYATIPDDPEKPEDIFMGWYQLAVEDDTVQRYPWDFESDTVPADGLVLYAEWQEGESYTGGTTTVMYIGNREDIDLDRYDPDNNQDDRLKYEKIYKPGSNTEVLGVSITGVKNDPIDLVIPAKVYTLTDQYDVLEVRRSAFSSGCEVLRSIKFEMKNGVDTMEMFKNLPNLEYVDLSQTIMSEVQYGAFANCPELIAVKLPKGISTIGRSAFEGCTSLTKLVIPEGIHSLGEDAFLNCTGITEVSFGNLEGGIPVSNLYTIHSNAFRGMTGLEQLVLPEGVKTIDPFAFRDCTALKYVRLPKSATNLGYALFAGDTALEELYLGNMGSASYSGFGHFDESLSISVYSMNIFGNGVNMPEEIYPLPSLRRIVIGNGASNVCRDALTYRYVSHYDEHNYRSVFAGVACLDVVIEEGVRSIDGDAFYGCSAIRSIQLPQSLKTIGEDAFADCSGLTSVSLSERVTTLEAGAFRNCSGLQSFTFNNGLRTIGGGAFSGCSGLTELTVNEGVTSIGDRAFCYCSSLKNLVLPKTVTSYGVALFDGDCALETLVLGNAGNTTNNYTGSNPGLNTIFGDAYSYNPDDVAMPNMKTIVIGNGSPTINGYTLAYKYGEAIEDTPGVYSSHFVSPFATGSGSITLIIEEGVEEIGDNAFCGLTSIGKVILPGSLRKIGGNAFADCTKISTLELPVSLREIDGNAFANCSGLVNISFNRGLEKIGDGAFMNCTGLKRAILPEGLTHIGEQAFNSCTALEHVYLPRSAAELGQGILHGDAALRTLYIGNAAMISDAEDGGSIYRASIFQNSCYEETWGKYVNLETVTIGSGSAVIPAKAFVTNVQNPAYNYTRVMEVYPFDTGSGKTKLIIEDGVREIGDDAFRRASCLGEVLIPDTVETIGGYAFWECTGIRTVDLPESLIQIGNGAFADCGGLAEVRFNQRLEKVGDSAFTNCTSLKCAALPEGVTYVGQWAFCNCTALEHVYLPRTAATLGQGILSGDAALRTLYIGNAAMMSDAFDESNYTPASIFQSRCYDEAWGKYVNLETVTIGPGSTVIPADAFLTITQDPAYNYYRSIGAYPFDTGTGTAKLIIEEGVREIGYNALANASAFGEIVLPDSLNKIGSSAFSECTALKRMRMGAGITSIGEAAFNRCGQLTVYLPSSAAYAIQYLNDNQVPFSIEGMPPYHLNLNANGGTFGTGGTVITSEVSWLSALSALPEPVNGTRRFSGWFRDAAATQPFDTETEIMPAADLTLYAGWDINLHRLTLILSEGSLDGDTVRLIPVGIPFLDSIVPVRAGSVFTGWYTDGKLQSEWKAAMPDRDLVLYAGWAVYGTHGKYTLADNEATLVRYECGADEQAVYLPEMVEGKPLTGIAAGAFAGQPVVTLGLPAAVTQLEDGALDGMESLRSFRVAAGNSQYAAYNGVLYSADGSTLLRWPADKGVWCTVPEGVLRIADHAFAGAPVRNISLPDGLTYIGAGAFQNTSLETLDLPDSVTVVGPDAFRGCGQLTLVTAGENLAEIGEYAFANGSLAAVYYGPLTGAFADYCEEAGLLYNLYLVTAVVDDGEEKMYTAQAGKELVIPAPVWEDDNTVFDGWYEDEELRVLLPDEPLMPQHGLTLYGTGRQQFELAEADGGDGCCLIRYLLNRSKVSVPSSINGVPVTAIAAGCFGPDVTEITIPASVTDIAENAFSGGDITFFTPPDSAACAYATAHGYATQVLHSTIYYRTNGGLALDAETAGFGDRIALPEPVRPGWQFEGWYTDRKLEHPVELQDDDLYEAGGKDVTLYAAWSVSDEDIALFRFELNAAGTGLTVTGLDGNDAVIEIPASAGGYPVVAIGPQAMAWKESITEVWLPDSVKDIGEEAFEGCGSLESIALGGTTVIGRNALKNCDALQAIELPDSLLRIEYGALANTSITDLTLPAGFLYLDGNALNGCTELAAVYVEDGSEYYRSEDGVLYDIVEDTLVKYPCRRPGTTYTAAAGTYAIGVNAFENAAALQQIILPDSVWSLGKGCFMGCTGLQQIPEMNAAGLTRIPENCFRGCVKLTEVTIPQQITRIDSGAFYRCDNLKTIHIPESVTVIGEKAFANTEAMIFGRTGSEAERFAAENGIGFTNEGDTVQTGLALSASELTLSVEEQAALAAFALPEGAVCGPVTWTSSETRIARVSDEGEVTAVGRGRAVITAWMAGGFTAECVVTVEGDGQVSQVILDGVPDRMTVGDTSQASVYFVPVTAQSAVTWTAGDPEVLSVSPDGGMTALSAGIARIRATADTGIYAEATVIVYSDERRIEITAPVRQAAAGETVLLTAVHEGGTIIWTAQPDSVATVSDSGVLTMNSHGFVTVRAAYEDNPDRYDELVLECPGEQVLTLPVALFSIEEQAFSGIRAEIVVLPETVQDIGAYAFADCPNLYKIVIPGMGTRIAEHAFDNTGVTIVCPAGSEAYAYAAAHHIPCIPDTGED